MGLSTLLIKTGIALALLLSPCSACQHGYFGSECKDTCSTHCSGNGSCNSITGVCDNGCKDGWSGSTCGTKINADGDTDSTLTITVSVLAVSGFGITSVVLLFLFKRKKACFEIHVHKDIKIEKISNAVIATGADLQGLASRSAIAAPPSSGPLAINSI